MLHLFLEDGKSVHLEVDDHIQRAGARQVLLVMLREQILHVCDPLQQHFLGASK